MYWRNSKGAALPLVIILFVVLMLFGTTMIMTWSSEGNLTNRYEKKAHSKYAAQSAAVAIAEFISDPVNSTHPLLVEISSLAVGESLTTQSSNSQLAHSTIDVTISKNSDEKIEVYARGNTGDVSDDVTVLLTGGTVDTSLMFNELVYAEGTLNTTGFGAINGDITYGGNILPATGTYSNVNGDVTHMDLDYPPITPPIPLESHGKISTKVAKAISPDKIRVMNSPSDNYDGDFIDELDAGTYPVRFESNGIDDVFVLIVKDANIKKGFILPDNDKLYLYVMPGGVATIKTPGGDSLDAQRIIIFGMPGSEINFTSNDPFHGFIYAPEADVTFQTAQIDFHGAVISNNFNLNNVAANTDITYEAFDSDFDWASYVESTLKIHHVEN